MRAKTQTWWWGGRKRERETGMGKKNAKQGTMECAMKKLVYKSTLVLLLPHSWISLNTTLLTDADKLFNSLDESLMPME